MSRRRQLVRCAAVLSVLIGGIGTGLAHAATGTALYVDDDAAGCSDTGPGSPAEPFCQIQPAADSAGPGDTVHVARNKTPYAPVNIGSIGAADAPVTFVAAPGDNAAATAAVVLTKTSTPAMTFSGAQYVDVSGFNLSSSGTSTLVFSQSQHISYDTGGVTTAQAATGADGTIAVDGSSSDVALTRLHIAPESGGPAFASAAGAQDITLADDVTSLGGGISATGTTGIRLAGDTIVTACGNGISLTDGSSGSVENTVVRADTTASCSDTGTPAEITVDAASAPQVTADYNAVSPLPAGTDYEWAGTAYGTSQAFRTGTGQGTHDLDQTDVTPDGTPLIDSADADAPGELATDLHGAQRVDDPLVADTGTGAGDYDRGATEVQDPLRLGTASGVAGSAYVGVPVTFTPGFVNPWSDSLDGYRYTFAFGDGTTVTSVTGPATHTYTQPTTGDTIHATVTVYRPDGTEMGTETSLSFSVRPLPPLTGSLDCRSASVRTAPSLPDTTGCGLTASGFSGYPITSDRITFGDGSAAVSATGSKSWVRHTYAAAGTYTVTQQLTDSGGRTFTDTTPTTVGPSYVATDPRRILDTRKGTGAAERQVGPAGVVRLKVLGVGGVPSSGVTAVTLNVTDTHATASSYVTVYPDGTSRPTASDLDFTAGRTNPNLVTVRVGAGGYVDLYNAHGHVDLIADTQGYFTARSDTSDDHVSPMSNLAPVTPTRVLDTRYGTGAPKGKVAPGSTTTVTLPKNGQGAGTVGAVLNVTVTGGSGSGVVTVYCGSRPGTSNLNYRVGQTVSNLVVTKVCTGGKVKLYNSGAHVHLIADLQGLYTNSVVDGTSPWGSPFVPANPTRFLDTRNGTGAPAGRLGANSTLTVKVAGVHGVPADATAVLANLTGVAPTTATHLTAYGVGSLPNVSNVNLSAGETRPVLAVIPIDAEGSIHIRNANGSLNIVADLEGYIG
ncbi:PKD domain-containing protein [Streptomyces doebereineriae]|uniref:PKD domain-containing protein n=1 Tax=Streptomyces doebereineriae TaxID=3075528 RepID=A0ABU2V322_9ACTN|nr:PKD domain-containing protein [Streptomyces sp. DSM 41640]MDT0479963.1 PKD domain-containing protein [Streptomyces sp. DSM 41640]